MYLAQSVKVLTLCCDAVTIIFFGFGKVRSSFKNKANAVRSFSHSLPYFLLELYFAFSCCLAPSSPFLFIRNIDTHVACFNKRISLLIHSR